MSPAPPPPPTLVMSQIFLFLRAQTSVYTHPAHLLSLCGKAPPASEFTPHPWTFQSQSAGVGVQHHTSAPHVSLNNCGCAQDKFKTSSCGDGTCQSGECEQCPRDCLDVAACRQDCVVPRCQVRQANFTTPSGQWILSVDPAVSASVDWQNGTAGSLLYVTTAGSLATQIVLYQNAILLCQEFRCAASSVDGVRGVPAGQERICLSP